jgi:protein Tob/BTG
MRIEVTSAANFLVRLLRLNKESAVVSDQQLEVFRAALIETLRRRYQEHWFPEKPCKGSGYRCIRINGKMDPVLAQAGGSIGIPGQFLHTLFPSELTMWIDPREVSYRIGENGSICVLYDEREVEETMRNQQQSANNHGSTSSSPSPSLSTDSSAPSSLDGSGDPSGCKESVRMEMEFMMDARNILAFEHLASYVSS